MSKLNKCTVLSSHWQNCWILRALPLELPLPGGPCSHQPCADQHISNGGTHTPSQGPLPAPPCFQPASWEELLCCFDRNPLLTWEYTERMNNRFGLRNVWKLLLKNQESEMETPRVEDWVKISSWMQRKISWMLLMIFIMFLLLNEYNKICFSYVIPNINRHDILKLKIIPQVSQTERKPCLCRGVQQRHSPNKNSFSLPCEQTTSWETITSQLLPAAQAEGWKTEGCNYYFIKRVKASFSALSHSQTETFLKFT